MLSDLVGEVTIVWADSTATTTNATTTAVTEAQKQQQMKKKQTNDEEGLDLRRPSNRRYRRRVSCHSRSSR